MDYYLNKCQGNSVVYSPKYDILNNIPLDDTLHVITVISNPCSYRRRITLAKEFIERMSVESHVTLYVVELSYDGIFEITDSVNPRHLQINCTDSPIWMKENMINMGVDILLPHDWKAMAWIDADIEFENAFWALDTLKILNGSKDIVQIFSHCIDMDAKLEPMKVHTSFGFQYSKNAQSGFWHSGYVWAITRKAYDSIGGIYDLGILGSGDNHIAKALIGMAQESYSEKQSPGYKKSILEFQKVARTLKLGYVPGVIRHFFHGSKKNRKYGDRWKILTKYQYDPYIHLEKNEFGMLSPTPACPKGLLKEIIHYFQARKEDN